MAVEQEYIHWIKKNAYISQIVLLVLGIPLLWFTQFQTGKSIATLLNIGRMSTILILGTGVAIFMIGILLGLNRLLPKHLLDDGGINEAFVHMPLRDVMGIMAVGAIAEELMLRAAVQTIFTYWFDSVTLGVIGASGCFAAMHIRYVRKPILFFVTWGLGAGLGVLYISTGSIGTVIWSHFLVNISVVYLAKRKVM